MKHQLKHLDAPASSGYSAYTSPMGSLRVPEIAIDDKSKREKLKAKRNLLFERYLKNPEDTQRALEIKIIDDQVAEFTKQIDRKVAAKI
jgi:hypothetical protein